MNRDSLAWAFSAVIPHAVKVNGFVGLTIANGVAYVHATDSYTLGIARMGTELADLAVYLPIDEATDLMRFVRPGRKSEQGELVELATREAELHVAFESDSAVFGTEVPEAGVMPLGGLLGLAKRIYDAPVEFDECVYLPELVSRFAKAKGRPEDRLRIMPRRVVDRNGVAVVTVGLNFIGAITGLTYDQLGANTVSSFLKGIERLTA